MSMKTAAEKDLSYELYKEIAEELCVPVDTKLSLEVRFELYTSKLVFLRNLYEQCFKAVNNPRPQGEFYTGDDLHLIHQAMECTKEFLRATVLETFKESLNIAATRKPGVSSQVAHTVSNRAS